MRRLGLSYQWNLAQVEYATDVVFHRQADLQPLYAALVRTAIQAVKPGQTATLLGRKHKLHADNTEEIGNDFQTRIQGARIKHHMGPASIKMSDKAGIILRIQTTTNNPKWCKHYRTVALPRLQPLLRPGPGPVRDRPPRRKHHRGFPQRRRAQTYA